MFAPYKVETWDDIPDEVKDADGAWVNDYGGYMSIGYDSAKVPDVTSLKDLLGPEFKGAVALNGDPTQAGSAFRGVLMAGVSNGRVPPRHPPCFPAKRTNTSARGDKSSVRPARTPTRSPSMWPG